MNMNICAYTYMFYFTLFPFYKFPINATEQHMIIKEAEFIKNTMDCLVFTYSKRFSCVYPH